MDYSDRALSLTIYPMLDANVAREKMNAMKPVDQIELLLAKIPEHILEILNSAVELSIRNRLSTIKITLSCSDVRLPVDMVNTYKSLRFDSDVIDYKYGAPWRVLSRTLEDYIRLM